MTNEYKRRKIFLNIHSNIHYLIGSLNDINVDFTTLCEFHF